MSGFLWLPSATVSTDRHLRGQWLATTSEAESSGDNQDAIAEVFNPVLGTLMRLVQKASHVVVRIGEVD